RREFLKETASKTTLLSVTGMGLCLGRAVDLNEAVQCTNCRSVNIYSRSYLPLFIQIRYIAMIAGLTWIP
ncbi:MAG: hypothetical protein K8R28_09960, partial [Desulfobacterales bacterium]|nr:hypothetical protein [Desulfobacterales bacterium]